MKTNQLSRHSFNYITGMLMDNQLRWSRFRFFIWDNRKGNHQRVPDALAVVGRKRQLPVPAGWRLGPAKINITKILWKDSEILIPIINSYDPKPWRFIEIIFHSYRVWVQDWKMDCWTLAIHFEDFSETNFSMYVLEYPEVLCHSHWYDSRPSLWPILSQTLQRIPRNLWKTKKIVPSTKGEPKKKNKTPYLPGEFFLSSLYLSSPLSHFWRTLNFPPPSLSLSLTTRSFECDLENFGDTGFLSDVNLSLPDNEQIHDQTNCIRLFSLDRNYQGYRVDCTIQTQKDSHDYFHRIHRFLINKFGYQN